jgi:hypothetical protein
MGGCGSRPGANFINLHFGRSGFRKSFLTFEFCARMPQKIIPKCFLDYTE